MTEIYSPGQVSAVLKALGISIKGTTYSEYQALCPFHSNTNTPAFSINKRTGVYTCFSPQCGKSGGLVELIMKLTQKNQFEARRLILKHEGEAAKSFAEELDDIFSGEPELQAFSQETIDRLYNQFWELPDGQEYMFGRGFDEETLRHFSIGYSAAKNLISIPVHDSDGMPIGLVGRTLKDKRFIHSDGFPRAKAMFNLHRAKRAGGTAIVCESSFDAMRIHQAGYPQAVATLGNLGHYQKYYLNRFFSKIIIFTDFDDKDSPAHKKEGYCYRCYPKECRGHNPGRDLGVAISALPGKEILWASYGFKQVYPHGAKDATDLTVEEVRQCVENAVNDFEYTSWGLY